MIGRSLLWRIIIPPGGPDHSARRPGSFRPAAWIILSSFLILSCRNDTDDAAQFFLRGNVQLQKREYTEAIRFYTEALTKKPDFADAYNNRGLAKFRNGDQEGAQADYTRAIQADPDFGAAYINRAETLLETGDAAGSLADLSHIEGQYRDSTFYQARLGDTYVRLNKPALALAAYDRAIKLDPNNVDALTNRGAFYFGQKNYGQAERDVQQALRLNPKQDAALNNQSLLLVRTGNYTEALTYVERALAVHPTQPYYLNNKGYILLKLARPAEALPLIQQSLRLDDQNGWAHRSLGLYYQSQHQPDKAQAEFTLAQKLGVSVEEK